MKFTEMIQFDKEIVPMHQQLQNEKNPIFILGAGALARNIYQYCREYEISICGCFESILSTEKRYFEDLLIYSLNEIQREYDKISVIIGYSSYAEGVEFLKKISNVERVYCLSSICCKVWKNISKDFILEQDHVLNELYECLEDDWSKKCLLSYFKSRINEKASEMFPYYKKEVGYYNNDVIKLTDEETLLDIGACVGSAIWPFIDAVEGKYHSIIALEPEQENYELLKEEINKRKIKKIILKRVCAYDKDGFVKFAGDKEQGGIKENAEFYIVYPAIRIDSLCDENEEAKNISIIKINFPFSVTQILDGAREIIKHNRPQIIIRIGFDENVLINTYKKIKELNSNYKFYLRYSIGIPQGLTLYAQ